MPQMSRQSSTAPQPPFATSAVQWVIFKDDISIYDTLPI